ncbi:MAG: hypothetical protein HRU49_11395 [Winogradskyella sp.]|uniref:c-type cytochrome n=1 Tax=Winogradskyella sp. TaxID=1883156 RepID=UPI0025F58734|nr:cytochrome c [Winogradskyella sp.]NRB84361.1 hypothetical protein [Winogradskyella sp.]
MRSKSLILILIIALFSGCSYNSEDDLTEQVIIDNFVTYETNIKPIIDNNCIVCHNNPPVNGAPMSLTTFSNVVEAVENRNLIGRISATDGSVMPAGGPRLPQSLIDLVIQWVEEGLMEN